MDDHRNLAKILRGIKGRFVLSYNNSEAIRELYKGFKIEEIGIKYNLGSGDQKEVVELIISN